MSVVQTKMTSFHLFPSRASGQIVHAEHQLSLPKLDIDCPLDTI